MMVRTSKTLVAFAWALSCCLSAAQSTPSLPAPAHSARTPYMAVLVWHDVVLGGKDVWFDTTRDSFRAQLEAIRRGRFHVISLDLLRDHLTRGSAVPPRPLVLTFDDNGHGIYENAFPLLKRYGFPATLFVHTNFVGKTTSKKHNSWAELQAMQRSGLITIASLTANHPEDLRTLDDAAVTHEFRLSKFSLEHRLGKPVYAVAYPYDNYDDRVARLARAAGFELGFSEDWGNPGDSASLLTVHRYSVLTRFDQALSDVAKGGP